MESARGYVYKWVNKINGKWYVGSHNGTKSTYRASGKLINKAFNKYGMDNFKCYKLYCDNFRELEEEILKREDAMNNPMSYNLTNVAKSWDHVDWTGRKHSEESKRKISEAAKKRPKRTLSEEHKAKIGLANKGNKRPDLAKYNKTGSFK